MEIHIIVPLIPIIIGIVIIIIGFNNYDYICPINHNLCSNDHKLYCYTHTYPCNNTMCDRTCIDTIAEIFYSDSALFIIFIGCDIIFCTIYIIIEYNITIRYTPLQET